MRTSAYNFLMITFLIGIWGCQPDESDDGWDGDTTTDVDSDVDGDTDTDADSDSELDDAYILPEVYDVEELVDGSLGIVGQVGKVGTVFGAGETAVELSSPGKQDAIALFYGSEYEIADALQWGDTETAEAAKSVQQLSDESLLISGESRKIYTSGNMSTDPPNTFIRKYASDHSLVWETIIRGSSSANTDNSNSLRAEPFVLSDQSIIVAGEFNGSATFGDDDNQQTLISLSSYSGFIARYDADGGLQWVQQIKSSSLQNVSMATDESIVVAGACDESCSFNDQEVTLTENVEEGYGAYLAKYDSNGSFRWAISIAEMDWDTGVMAINSPDNAFYVGGVYNEFITIGQGADQVTLTNPDRFRTPYLSKISEDGEVLWAKSLEIPQEIEEFRLLPDSRILLAGHHVDNSGSTASDLYSLSTISDEDLEDIATTTITWTRKMYSWPNVHISDDSLYLTGWYNEIMSFNVGDSSLSVENNDYIGAMYLAKVTLEGSLEWAGNIAGHNDTELMPPIID